MSDKNTGGSAFAGLKAAKIEMVGGRIDGAYVDEYKAVGGMSLRDYFAAKALIAIIGHGDIFTHEEHSDVARWAYGYSDAMLEERNK